MTADRLQAALQSALWIGLGLALCWLIALLGPILTPFLLAATLAYIGNPLVLRLTNRGLPRIAAVLLLMALLIALIALFVLALVPLLAEEGRQLITRLPDLINLINDRWAPWLHDHYGLNIKLKLTPAAVRQLLTANWDSVQTVLGTVASGAASSGQVVLQILSTLLLTPVVLFYLMRDWNVLLERVAHLVPRPWAERVQHLAADVDGILAEFLRGQLSVMALLALYYSAALGVAGIDFALPLGLVTGLLIFIPYVGYAIGFTLALAVAALQFDGFQPVIAVLAVFGIGQVLESFLLTPFLVGERIGLHPLAVIFALLAFGQLFGFVGILIALPASAALLVALRRLRTLYLASRFYTGPTEDTQ